MSLGQERLAPMLGRVGTTVQFGEVVAHAIVFAAPKDVLPGQGSKVQAKEIEIRVPADSLPGLQVGSQISIGNAIQNAGAVILEGGVLPVSGAVFYVVTSQPRRFGDGAMMRARCALA